MSELSKELEACQEILDAVIPLIRSIPPDVWRLARAEIITSRKETPGFHLQDAARMDEAYRLGMLSGGKFGSWKVPE